jgi:hypothetical protein
MAKKKMNFKIVFFIGIIVTAAWLLASVIQTGAQPQKAITGQNNPAVDPQAVQEAVGEGGTIVLKGTFDFGGKGMVNITKDVTITGETDDKGAPITKIKGGFWTFHSPLPPRLPPEVPGPKITIQNIHFDGTLWCPIHLAYCSGATIANNKVTNLRPIPIPVPVFGKTGVFFQQAIVCGTMYEQPKEPKYQPGAFTGQLIITDNEIDMYNENPVNTLAQGVFIVWTTGINAQIQRNTIFNCSRNSIEMLDNYLGQDGSGMIILKDNKIVTATEGASVPTPNTPNGIIVGWFMDMSSGLDPQRNIKHVIVNNAIRTRGKTSGGIAALTDGVVVVNNTIISEGEDSIPLSIISSDGYLGYNKLEGISSKPGVLVSPFKPFKGSKNFVIENDFKQFKTSAAEVVFGKDSCNNLFVGPTCKISDLGSNNLIQMSK